MHERSLFIEGSNEPAKYGRGGEIPCRMRTNIPPFKRRCLMYGVQVQTQTGLVVVVRHALAAWRQSFDHEPRQSIPHE